MNRGLPELGSTGASLSGMAVVADIKKHAVNKPLHVMCYQVEYGRSASTDVGINRGESQNLKALGPTPLEWGMTDLEIRPFPSCYPAEFSCSVSNALLRRYA